VEAGGTIDVTACSLDDPEPFEPGDHVWADRMVSWLRMDDGLPRFGLGRDAMGSKDEPERGEG
jgi:hypothetical protein